MRILSVRHEERLYCTKRVADSLDLGRFPDTVVNYLGDDLPKFTDEEWRLLKGSSEFFGWNHYGTQLASGKRLETDNPRLVSFGSIERVFEKDGVLIGNKGEAGHPYDGESRCVPLFQPFPAQPS